MKIIPRVALLKALLSIATVVFTLQGLAQAAQSNIHISGASARLEENIRAHLSVVSERCTTEPRRLNRLLPQVQLDIERAAQALGYYRVEHSSEFTSTDDCWELNIELVPGTAVVFGTINVEVTPDATRPLAETDPFAQLLRDLPIRPGAQLIHSDYESLKSSLSTIAVENGYFAARFNRSELLVDVDNNLADVIVEFDPGVRFRFGTIHISPIEALSERFISRFLPFAAGEPYATEQLIELRSSLNNSQYFSEVAVTPRLNATQATGDNGVREVPVDIDLVMRAQHSWSTGIGVTTDIGPRVTMAYEDRYLNRSGHRLNSDIALSPLEQRANLSYNIPLREPSTESLSISTGYVGQNNDTFITDTSKLGVSYRSSVDPWVLGEDWLQTIFINYQRERSELNKEREQSNLTISGINWAKTQADDPIYPTRGWRLFTQISGASNAFLSDTSFLQLYASGKYVRDMGYGRFLLRTELGTSIVDDVKQLPVSIRYFTGGDQSIRGYKYGTLGAVNAQGEVIGGKHLLTGSIEYDFPVRPSWRGAVFYDAGNSFNDYSKLALKSGVGIGVRWQSPIGPIRADIARGIEDGGFRLHITMGPDL